MLITYFGISSLMILICYPSKKINVVISRVITLYVSAFVFGGILNIIYFNSGLGVWLKALAAGRYKKLFALIIISSVTVIFICRTLKKYEQMNIKRKNTFNVTLIHNDRQVEVMALYDTGNCLTEPITKRAVSICSFKTADELLGDNSETIKKLMECMDKKAYLSEKVYIVPFVSVGNENGLITAVEITSMKMQIRGKTVEVKKPLIGFYGGKISSDDSYEMILNSAVMSNNIE